jgi:hypothetical protein
MAHTRRSETNISPGTGEPNGPVCVRAGSDSVCVFVWAGRERAGRDARYEQRGEPGGERD